MIMRHFFFLTADGKTDISFRQNEHMKDIL